MGYQALLFCPDEKTARTVTQVLSELEFAVETCAEPFAAVKKLMGEHFDAIVVDCDNEQNATLLFKSARNSTSNQASLAVAVVEGQAGVAKAFRIGANLVLTKPINVEQAKGTLRVARGLLRKGEPGKPAAAPPAAAAPAAPPAKPAAPKPVAAQQVAPVGSAQRPSSLPPVPRPAVPHPPVASPPAVVASTKPSAGDEDLLGINEEKPTPVVHAAPPAPKPAPIPAPVSEVRLAPPAAVSSSGAASAPAPAREIPQPLVAHKAADSLFESPVAPAPSESSTYATPAPSFTFGGAAVPEESSDSKKKIGIGIAAAVVCVVGAYFAWSHFQGNKNAAPVSSAPIAASQPVNPAPAPAATSAPVSSAPTVSQPVAKTNEPAASAPETTSEEDQPAPEKETSSKAATKGSSSAKPAATPLMVKGGAAPSVKKAAAADAPAPSVIGMAVPASTPPPLNLGASSTVTPKPILQTLNISQGVSRGLLIKKVQPIYPQNAMSMHVEGEVDLMATISKAGNITAVKVISGEQLLTRAAVEAVKQWKYKPYLLNGEPVEIQTQITVNFKLPH